MLENKTGEKLHSVERYRPLFFAAKNDDMPLVEQYLQAFLDEHTKNNSIEGKEDGNLTIAKLLSTCAFNNRLKVAEFVCSKYPMSSQHVHCALYKSLPHPSMFAFLLDNSTCNIDCYDEDFFCHGILSTAASEGCVESMKVFFERCSNVRSHIKHYQDKDGVYVEKFRNLEVIELLQPYYNTKKVNMLRVLELQEYILDEPKVVRILKHYIANGADVNVTRTEEGEKSCYGYKVVTSPLFMAMRNQRVEVVKYLVTVTDQKRLARANATSPVIAAVYLENLNGLKVLLEAGYSIDGRLEGREESNPPVAGGKYILNSVMFCMHHLHCNCWTIDDCREEYPLLEMLLNADVYLTKNLMNERNLSEAMVGRVPDQFNAFYLFLKYGAVEVIFENSVKKNEFFMKFKAMLSQERVPVTTFKHFSLLLDCFSSYEFVGKDASLLPKVQSLKQICHHQIRIHVLNHKHNLLALKNLPLPKSVIDYLFLQSVVEKRFCHPTSPKFDPI